MNNRDELEKLDHIPDPNKMMKYKGWPSVDVMPEGWALNEREQLLCDLLVAKRRIQMIDEELLCNTDKDAAIAIVRKLCEEFMN